MKQYNNQAVAVSLLWFGRNEDAVNAAGLTVAHLDGAAGFILSGPLEALKASGAWDVYCNGKQRLGIVPATDASSSS